MNWVTPIATVAYHNKINANVTVGPITEETDFGVRAYLGSNESQNADTVYVTPLVPPTAASGDLEETWRDEGNFRA